MHFLAKSGRRDSLRICRHESSVEQADNTSKHGEEMEVVVDKKCRGKFRRFGALCINFYMLQMIRKKL